jgi:hypothetical protein
MPDAYTRKARIAPAALVGVPGGALLIAGAISPDTVLRAIGVFLGALGILVAVLIRDAGRSVQPRLWEDWGGPPTTSRLRWGGDGPAAAIQRLHARVEAATGEQLPDAAAEAADQAEADRIYEEAVGVLRERTRDAATFPLVAAENADYGFRRNCLGVRPAGITVAGAGLVAGVLFAAVGSGSATTRLDRWVPAAVVCALCLGFWLLTVKPEWVKRAAENYADRLLGATDILHTEQSTNQASTN